MRPSRPRQKLKRKIWRNLKIAGLVAQRKDDRRDYLLGVFAVRSDGTGITASNGPAQNKTREVHAEYRASKKLDYGAVIYVTRVRADGSFGNAKPCRACRKALKSKKVKRVYYTISPKKYGVLEA